MPINRETLLCRYQYDPLDRLVDCTPSAQATNRRFYLKDRLATEIQGVVQRSIMQQEDHLLAEQQRQSGTVETRLLATDQQRSVLSAIDTTSPRFFAYTPYGHRPLGNGLLSLLGFNGERADPMTGCYLLGNGYRAFNPVLMRFNSPDSWSPFGEGGLNAYGYCGGDPRNQVDPNGHTFLSSMIKVLEKRALDNGNRQGLSALTKNLLTETKNNLGGTKSIKKLASQREVDPETLLVFSLPEMGPLVPSIIPDHSQIASLTPAEINKILNHTRKKIFDLKNVLIVQQDLVDGLPSKLGKFASRLLPETQAAIYDQSKLLAHLSGSPPPYEQPPTYQDVLRNIRFNEL